jgi:acetyl esterase/lipase
MRTILSVIMGVALASLGMAQPSPPYSFQVYTDIAYYDGPDAHPIKHRLDLFVPEGLKDAPVLIFVHGGGWTSGDKNLYSFIGRAFAEQGFVTAVINYRLSPQVQHPAHIEDVARAFAWVYRNIAQYGGNPEKIFVMGHSAGGHLVALLALDEKYLQAHGLTLAAIKGAIPISGIYDV